MKTCFGHFLAFLLLAATATNLQAQSGSIDLAFGENGYVKRNIGNGGQFHGLLLQTDGKIITLGKNFNPSFKISRFHANGGNDNSFGSDGTVTFQDISAYCLSGGLLPDGKIMLAFGKSPSSSNNQDELKLLRLNTDGSFDNSFGLGGSVVIPNTGILNQCAERIHVLSNGDMILIGGKAEDGNAIHIVRVKANGTLDESFAQGGVLSISVTGGLGKVMSSFQAPNRIAIATTATSLNKLSVFRIFDNGVMDPSFDTDGRKEVNLPEFTFMGGIAALADGSIVVATSIGQSQGGSEFNVRKFKSNGSLDPAFGFNGETDINLNEACLATGLTIQSDGKILVGGMAGLGDGEDYSIARLHANGLLDNSFGNNGIAKNLDSSGDHCANTLALQADGKLLIGGFTPYGLATMARYITASANGANENIAIVSELGVSPNPAVGATTMARFTLAENATVHLEIYDMAGHLMSTTSRQLQKGQQNEPISVADLPAGVYMLHVRSMEYFSTKAFVKAE